MDDLGARYLAAGIIEQGCKDYVKYGIIALKKETTYSISMFISAAMFLNGDWGHYLCNMMSIDPCTIINHLDKRIILNKPITDRQSTHLTGTNSLQQKRPLL